MSNTIVLFRRVIFENLKEKTKNAAYNKTYGGHHRTQYTIIITFHGDFKEIIWDLYAIAY